MDRKVLQIVIGGLLALPPLLLQGWEGTALLLLSYGILSYDVIRKAVLELRYGQVFNESFLMSLATLGALAIGEIHEAIAVMFFYQVGEYFQDQAVDKSRKSIAALMDLRPDQATVLREGQRLTVTPEEVETGELILVAPGERIPLDGIVRSGQSFGNTAALTGESLPRELYPGVEVLSGTINQGGLLEIQVKSPYEESTISRILRLVEDSGSRKAAQEQFITRFARYYTPTVVVLAGLLFLLPGFLTGDFRLWGYRALAFLVVSCPCALVVSVPLSFYAGMGGASRRGLLVKGGTYLDALSKVRTVVFDKTGTLTQGEFQVQSLYPAPGWEEGQLLELAAYGEASSSHPIARSVLRAYGRTPDHSLLGHTEEIPGKGIRTLYQGETLLAGKASFLIEEGVQGLSGEDGALLHLSLGGRYAGALKIADSLKEDARAEIQSLRSLGIRRLVMLSGDEGKVAREIADGAGIDEAYGDLLPQDKVEILERIMAEEEAPVAFVGDGINDAPVLARADVGVAMGGIGSDAALEAADLVMMGEALGPLSKGILLSRKTMGIAYANIIMAIGIKVLVLILSAMGLVGLWWAVFADVGVTLLAVANALRALGRLPGEGKRRGLH